MMHTHPESSASPINPKYFTAAKPHTYQGNLWHMHPAIVKRLVPLPNWVNWRWELNEKGDAWTKVPYQPRNLKRKASTDNKWTWATYTEAVDNVVAGRADGAGFVLFETNICTFDIDDCINLVTGEVDPTALALIKRCGVTYVEKTVSGTGLRIIGRGGTKYVNRKQKIKGSKVSIESYRYCPRYITISGLTFDSVKPNMPDLGNIDAILTEVVEELDRGGGNGSPRDSGAGKATGPDKASGINFFREATLPRELLDLIRNGVPIGDRSDQFFHAVKWLKDMEWSPDDIIALLASYPDGIVSKYAVGDRIEAEVLRAYGKPDNPGSDGAQSEQSKAEAAPPSIELLWHGQAQDRAPRSWLVKNLIPETGSGLLSGQWGTAKTFAALDLAGVIMTATPFAGREVARQGGVLFVAAEGANEIPIRLQGVVEKLAPLKTPEGAAGNRINVDLERLPFAWIDGCPSLKDHFDQLIAASLDAQRIIREKFNLPLALIVVDTLTAAANFKDGNDAAEGQFIMNRLNELSRKTGAFVIAVDHFGKAIETGTRGTSAKEAAADMVLALLAERDIAGNISNTRMAVRKLRGGSTGAETPFNLKVVELGDDETTCVIEWKEAQSERKSTDQRERWPKSTKILKASLLEVLISEGQDRDPFGDGKMRVKTVPVASVRAEFMKRYPAETIEPAKRADAKRQAFNRAMKQAMGRDLIGVREIGGVDHLWQAVLD